MNAATIERFDAIVIGAGIIGAATALELAARGFKTLCVDRLPAAGYGSTSNSCAIIRTYYSTHDGCAMAFEGYHYWKNWREYIAVTDESGFAEFIECGALIVKTEHNNYMRRILEIAADLGIAYEEWDDQRMRERLPIWDTQSYAPVKRPDDEDFGEPTGEAVAGAVLFPQAGYVNDPQLATHNIQRAAEHAGALFRFNSTVAAVHRDAERVTGIELDDGTRLDAKVVVNVGGPHSAKVNELAGVAQNMRIKPRALRHEVPYVPSPAEYNFEMDGLVTSDSDVGCYCRPATGNRILVGSEDPACDERHWVDDPDHFYRELTEQGRAQVMRAAQRIPSLGIPEHMQGIVDLYDVTEDWMPIYDCSDLPGYYMAIGSSGNQFKNAPVAGALMAHLIEQCENGHDHDTNPIVFDLKHTAHRLNLGTYSRNREINPDSSFTVLG